MSSTLQDTLSALQQGEVIAYATEAVYGLGCDPNSQQAVEQLLQIKSRPVEKGLIIIAGELEQLRDWIDVDVIGADFPYVLETWPGPNTWLLPCKPSTPDWLTGSFDTLAVRVSAHPGVRELCTAFGKGLVSTSANPAGLEPARSVDEVQAYFPDLTVLPGSVNRQAQPSVIRDAKTQRVIRA